MTTPPDNDDFADELAAIAAWGDPGQVPPMRDITSQPIVSATALRPTTPRRSWRIVGAAAVFALLAGLVVVMLTRDGDGIDTNTVSSDDGRELVPTAACTDVARFAQRLENVGITYDYDPSDSALDLASSTSVVVRGDLVAVRELTEDGNSFAVFRFRATEASNDLIAAGDEIEVSFQFGPASVPYREIEDSFTPSVPSVLFLHSTSGPGGWTPALEGFWVSCGDDEPATSARIAPTLWQHDGTLDELFAAVVDHDEQDPDEIEFGLGFEADGIRFDVDCTPVPETRLEEQLGTINTSDDRPAQTWTILDIDAGDARAIDRAPDCDLPPGWILALREGIEPERLQQILGALIDPETAVSEVREMTEDERRRIDDAEDGELLDCVDEGSRTWDYGPIDESSPQDEAPVDGLVKALLAEFADDALTMLPITGWVHLTDDDPGTAVFLATRSNGEWLGVARIGGSLEAGIWRPNSLTSCLGNDAGGNNDDDPVDLADMCLGIAPFPGGEPLHGTVDFGSAWPVLADDLILTNGFSVVAFNNGEVRGTLLAIEAFPPWSSVFVDGAGGLVVQTRDRILHVRPDRTLVTLTVEEDADSGSFPGYQLAGTARINGEWVAYAVKAPAAAYEVGQGDLVLLPLDGGSEQIVTKVVQEEGGAWPYYDTANEVFVLSWGSQGDYWITGVTAAGEAVELPWNQWEGGAFYSPDQVIVGVNGGQAFRGIYDEAGILTLEGFSASTGDTVHASRRLPIGPTLALTLLPLKNSVVISADTLDGPCTRIFAGDATYVDIEFRGFASPPAGP